MSRNSSGTYTLPTGNPVVSGTIIEASWANSTLSDISDALTDSLSRSGKGGMTAPFRLIDGTVSVPAFAFSNETGSGAYRAAAGDWYLTVLGSGIVRLRSSGADVTGAFGVSGALSVSGNATVGGTFGVTGASTLASLGVTGNATVGGTFGVTGASTLSSVGVTGNATVGGTLGVTGVATLSANPTLSAGVANGVAYLNGSKSLVSGSALVFDGSKLGINKASPYASLDVGTTGAQTLTSVFTTGVDDLNFRVGFGNGTAGGTGSLQGQVGLYYLGVGEAAAVAFYRGGGATDASMTLRTNNADRLKVFSDGKVQAGTGNGCGSRLTVNDHMAITNGGGAQVLLIGNQDSGGTNRPAMIQSANSALQFGYGNSWSNASGGTFTKVAEVAGDNFYFNSGFGSSALAFGCRAWVNLNGATNGIRGSGNVSSLTDLGTANYRVNFSTSMTDTNFTAVGCASGSSASNLRTVNPYAYATGSVSFGTTYADGQMQEVEFVNVAVIR